LDAIGSRLKKITIAITIAMKNHSGKISDRFSFHHRIPVLIAKSISDFHFVIGSRLKSDFLITITGGA